MRRYILKSTKYQVGFLLESFLSYLLCVLLITYAFYKYGGLSSMWIGLMISVIGVPLVVIVVGLLYAVWDMILSKRLEVKRNEIEKSYPQARVTTLSNGNWLITSKVTGETINEIKGNFEQI